MADQTQTSTQQAAQTVVNRINAGAQNATIANQATVARAAENPPAQPWNRTLEAPPSAANGGKK